MDVPTCAVVVSTLSQSNSDTRVGHVDTSFVRMVVGVFVTHGGKEFSLAGVRRAKVPRKPLKSVRTHDGIDDPAV